MEKVNQHSHNHHQYIAVVIDKEKNYSKHQ